jgi:hypothetical protein
LRGFIHDIFWCRNPGTLIERSYSRGEGRMRGEEKKVEEEERMKEEEKEEKRGEG